MSAGSLKIHLKRNRRTVLICPKSALYRGAIQNLHQLFTRKDNYTWANCVVVYVSKVLWWNAKKACISRYDDIESGSSIGPTTLQRMQEWYWSLIIKFPVDGKLFFIRFALEDVWVTLQCVNLCLWTSSTHIKDITWLYVLQKSTDNQVTQLNI